jgi:EAL domain-containing protein (putative c-di-GMP-specific phosphodiesterase class I)
VLHYQPKVNMRTGEVVGFEALVRWEHPKRGLLLPGAFLPLIDKHPLSEALGNWVMRAALQQMSAWLALDVRLAVSVNVGARQLQQADFADQLSELLASYPAVDANSLELEILETSALEDISAVSKVLHACRRTGVHFAIDDFGTGYSSLTYLRRLSVDTLKIDQSFVRDMLDDQDDLAIVNGVIGLAAAFHRQVIAEGVETVAHGLKLLTSGCELAQGYVIARPMPGSEVLAWTANWRTFPAWSDNPGLAP